MRAADPLALHRPRGLGPVEPVEIGEQALGEQVVEHYSHFYSLEQQAFDRAVTDWERKRYFEQI